MRRGMGGRGRGGGPPPRGVGMAMPSFGLNNGGRIPFDLTFCQEIFPKGVEPDDSALTTALLKRNTEITPTTEETQATQNLVTRVQGILENLILTPGTFDACQVDEIRQVGSFKHGTILAGHKTADFVVILKTLPTKEGVEALHVRVSEELKQTDCVRSSSTARGFDLSSVDSTVRVMVTTIPPNMKKLDPNLHLDAKHMNEHWQAIRHSRWFEENAQQSTIKVLIRILRDMRARFPPFQPIQPWMFDLLAHFATMNNPIRQPLPINAAFRRTLSLMSAGMYLPGYAGSIIRGNNLTFEDMDGATAAAQTLVLIMGQGGFEAVLGLVNKGDILNVPTVWDGVVVSPQQRVYDKTLSQDLEIDEEIEAEA